MNIFLSKLLRQALAQRTKPKFARGERTGEHIPTNTCRCTSKQQRSPLATFVQIILSECQDRLPAEGERTGDVCFDTLLQAFLSYVQEFVKSSVGGVPQRRPDRGSALRRRPLEGLDFVPNSDDGLVGVVIASKSGCLSTGLVDLVGNFLGLRSVSGNNSYSVALLCKQTTTNIISLIFGVRQNVEVLRGRASSSYRGDSR